MVKLKRCFENISDSLIDFYISNIKFLNPDVFIVERIYGSTLYIEVNINDKKK